jgi:uncharacterized phage protein gp47/JayE
MSRLKRKGILTTNLPAPAMPIVRFTPLESPIIDDRSETDLVERAIARVYQESGGKINDFSTSSPARALIEGQAFAGAELLYRVNKLPEAVAIEYLKIAGIQRRLGSASQTTLTFTLTAALSGAFTIPAGYQVRNISTRINFATDAVLVIPAGQISGTVSATCTQTGSKGNFAAYTLRELTQPLAFLGSVTNTVPATGGTDAETMDEVKSRAFAAIRRRGLVSADDYQEETRALLGVGSVAHCIGNLAADGISYRLGSVHVFCLNKDGSLLNPPQLSEVQAALQRRSHVSIAVYTSNVALFEIDLYVIAKLIPGTNPQTISNAIYQSLKDYLSPGKLPLGETIVLKELEYLVRNAGVEYVQSVTMGEHLLSRSSTNLKLPQPYSAAKLKSVGVELVGADRSYSQFYGQGDPD